MTIYTTLYRKKFRFKEYLRCNTYRTTQPAVLPHLCHGTVDMRRCDSMNGRCRYAMQYLIYSVFPPSTIWKSDHIQI